MFSRQEEPFIALRQYDWISALPAGLIQTSDLKIMIDYIV
jgi:hypothetical protein